jgi:hypothetical protein
MVDRVHRTFGQTPATPLAAMVVAIPHELTHLCCRLAHGRFHFPSTCPHRMQIPTLGQ